MRQTVCAIIAMAAFIVAAGAIETNIIITIAAFAIMAAAAIFGKLYEVERK